MAKRLPKCILIKRVFDIAVPLRSTARAGASDGHLDIEILGNLSDGSVILCLGGRRRFGNAARAERTVPRRGTGCAESQAPNEAHRLCP